MANLARMISQSWLILPMLVATLFLYSSYVRFSQSSLSYVYHSSAAMSEALTQNLRQEFRDTLLELIRRAGKSQTLAEPDRMTTEPHSDDDHVQWLMDIDLHRTIIATGVLEIHLYDPKGERVWDSGNLLRNTELASTRREVSMALGAVPATRIFEFQAEHTHTNQTTPVAVSFLPVFNRNQKIMGVLEVYVRLHPSITTVLSDARRMLNALFIAFGVFATLTFVYAIAAASALRSEIITSKPLELQALYPRQPAASKTLRALTGLGFGITLALLY